MSNYRIKNVLVVSTDRLTNSLQNVLQNSVSPEKMMDKDYTKREIKWVKDGFVGLDDFLENRNIRGCIGCIYAEGANTEGDGGEDARGDECPFDMAMNCNNIIRPAHQFSPERLAKFRLTGEDDG